MREQAQPSFSPVIAAPDPVVHVDPRDKPGDDERRDDRGPTTPDAIPPALRQRGSTPRQVLVMTVIGTLVLAVFASADLSSWLDRMGGGRFLTPLQHAAAEWHGAAARLGLDRPQKLLRSTMHRMLDWQWSGQD